MILQDVQSENWFWMSVEIFIFSVFKFRVCFFPLGLNLVCVCVFWMCEASLLFRSLKDVRVNTQKILAFVPLPFILLLFPLPLTSTGNHPFYLLVSYPSIISLSLFKKYLYIWLCWVLVVTCRDGTGAPALGAWSLSHWTIREVPWYFFWQKSLCVCVCVCVYFLVFLTQKVSYSIHCLNLVFVA